MARFRGGGAGNRDERVWIMDPDAIDEDMNGSRNNEQQALLTEEIYSDTISIMSAHPASDRNPQLPGDYNHPSSTNGGTFRPSLIAGESPLPGLTSQRNPSGSPTTLPQTHPGGSSSNINLRSLTSRLSQEDLDKGVMGSSFGKGGVSSSANASYDARMISHVERNYLLSVERGDAGSVRQFLEQAKQDGSLNINCIDPLGRSSLLIAIENENVDIMRMLLEHNVETGDALLYAINEENVEAVETILTYLDDIGKFTIETQGVEIGEHSAFTPDITPIILAAHRDNFEIINLLHNKRAFVPHPHDVRCDCKDCLQSQSEDSLRFSRSRINSYRALSSPSLICICQRDPLMYAFELSWELRRLANIENEFRTEYQELSQKCQKFAVDLLDQTRGSCELEIILNHDTSDRMVFRERTENERMQLARLKLAIQLRQKRFVAHPNCQQLLASIWYEGLPGFRRRNYVFKIVLILGVFLAFPMLSLMYLIAPKTTVGQLLRKPFVKFLCRSASYCVFLFLLILASQRINYDTLFKGDSDSQRSENGSVLTTRGPGQARIPSTTSTIPVPTPAGKPLPSHVEVHDADNDRKESRGPPPTPVEWAILAWVAGLVWAEVKQLWDIGPYEYSHNMWNILDFITNSLYVATMVLRLIAYFQVEQEIAAGYGNTLGRSLFRKDWDAWDPTLISECIFATANIFSSLKLVHMFTVNPHLGPLQISLGRMVFDILKFFFVYCLVLFAFACGLNQLFWYYATMRSKECAKGWGLKNQMLANNRTFDVVTQNEMEDLLDSCDQKYSSFANLFNTLQTLFWSTFGLVGLDPFRLKENHFFTQWAGKTIFGTYSTISLVVLLNMLIAMMSNSYTFITNQADVEWKFARSRLWIEYFEEGGTIPPPFNIIPSPKTFYYLFKALCSKFKCSKRIHHSKQRSMRLQKILKAVSDKEKMYKKVMDNLVKRYVAFVQRQKQQSEGVSEDDVNEIKQDISSFRYELLEILKRNSFDTGHANIAQRSTAKNKKKSAMAERRLMKSCFQLELESLPESRQAGGASAGNSLGLTRRRVQMADSGIRYSGDSGGSSASSQPSAKSKLSRLKSLSKRISHFKQSPGSGGANIPSPLASTRWGSRRSNTAPGSTGSPGIQGNEFPKQFKGKFPPQFSSSQSSTATRSTSMELGDRGGVGGSSRNDSLRIGTCFTSIPTSTTDPQISASGERAYVSAASSSSGVLGGVGEESLPGSLYNVVSGSHGQGAMPDLMAGESSVLGSPSSTSVISTILPSSSSAFEPLAKRPSIVDTSLSEKDTAASSFASSQQLGQPRSSGTLSSQGMPPPPAYVHPTGVPIISPEGSSTTSSLGSFIPSPATQGSLISPPAVSSAPHWSATSYSVTSTLKSPQQSLPSSQAGIGGSKVGATMSASDVMAPPFSLGVPTSQVPSVRTYSGKIGAETGGTSRATATTTEQRRDSLVRQFAFLESEPGGHEKTAYIDPDGPRFTL